MNSTLLSELQKCHSCITELEQKISKMSNLSDTNTEVSIEIAELQKRQTSENIKKECFGIRLLSGMILFFPLIFVSSLILTNLNFEANISSAMSGIVLALLLDILISSVVAKIKSSKNSQERVNKITFLEKVILANQQEQKILDQELKILLTSPNALLVKELIPPDYRKSYIVEKFIYFFRNGHVDTMKEAVHEYDNYRHNKKMQDAVEQSASSAAETARNAAKIAKTAEEIQFWTMINTYMNSK